MPRYNSVECNGLFIPVVLEEQIHPDDLLPPSRTTVKVAKSVNLENDGHESQQVVGPAEFSSSPND
jgi:hypothetical protein